MLQIIGWLGCFYLLVKAMEIMATAKRDEQGNTNPWAGPAAALALVGAVGFFFILGAQADANTAQLEALQAQTNAAMSTLRSY